MLFDTHCHLDRLKFNEHTPDVNTALQQARAAGVSQFLTVSVKLSEYETLKNICIQNDDVKMSVGIHPCEDVESMMACTAQELCALANTPLVIAIGETGLDYHYSMDTKTAQIHSFEQHIAAAKHMGLPLIVHTREAKADTLAILKDQQAGAGILHCFTEDWDMAKQAIDLGFYISFSGIVSFKNAAVLHDACKHVPLDKLLIETDSPYLAPTPHRGKSNVPAYLPNVAEAVAQIKQITVAQLATQLQTNFLQLQQNAAQFKTA